MEDLIKFYRESAGDLPCKLSAACPRELTEKEIKDLVGEKPPSRFDGKRRKKQPNVEELLIVNRES